MQNNILALFSGITVRYPKNNALLNISCYIGSHSLLAITGPNGGGKSTFLKIATSILKPTNGTYHLHNIDKHKDITYLPQNSQVNDTVPITVKDVVACGLFAKQGFWNGLNSQDYQKTNDALNKVGLEKNQDQMFHELSGGQKQRTLFARSIVQDTPLIFLDEPFSAVDAHTRDDLMKIILEWYKQGRTVVTVLHDIQLIQKFFPETLLISKDFICQGPTSSILTNTNLINARNALKIDGSHNDL